MQEPKFDFQASDSEEGLNQDSYKVVGGFSVFGKVEAGKDTLVKKESQKQIQQEIIVPQKPQRQKSALPKTFKKVQNMNQEVIKFIEYGRNKLDTSVEKAAIQKLAPTNQRAILPPVKKVRQNINKAARKNDLIASESISQSYRIVHQSKLSKQSSQYEDSNN